MRIDSKIDDIIEFSETWRVKYEPIVPYSSGSLCGWHSPLQYSLILKFNVDEALSVGDAYFSAKCTRVLRDRKEQNMSIYMYLMI